MFWNINNKYLLDQISQKNMEGEHRMEWFCWVRFWMSWNFPMKLSLFYYLNTFNKFQTYSDIISYYTNTFSIFSLYFISQFNSRLQLKGVDRISKNIKLVLNSMYFSKWCSISIHLTDLPCVCSLLCGRYLILYWLYLDIETLIFLIKVSFTPRFPFLLLSVR